jgi:lipopolysaccharide/colanic/teichoic acid biosynthesis glycosyltransferase
MTPPLPTQSHSIRPPTEPAEGVTPPWPEVDWVSANSRLFLEVPSDWYTAIKPTLDTLISVGLLLATFPFMIAAWVLIRITSAGPGFYVQTRSGLKNKPYSIIKIRSMYHSRSVAKNTDWANPNGDARVTAVGRVLRALHLDELPQLFNVLSGEMSLVGPRPERPEVIAKKQLADHVPGYDHRLVVKPGVTGLAQVQLPADTDVLSVRHKVCYDLYYLANQSCWLDVRICIATVLKAFLRPSTVQKLLVLPTREVVCEQFLAFLVAPSGEQPAVATAPVV